MSNEIKASELKRSPSQNNAHTEEIEIRTGNNKPINDQKVVRRSSRIQRQNEAQVSPDKTQNIPKSKTIHTNDNTVPFITVNKVASVTTKSDSFIFKQPQIQPQISPTKRQEIQNSSEKENKINDIKSLQKYSQIKNTIDNPQPSTSKVNKHEDFETLKTISKNVESSSHNTIKPECSNKEMYHAEPQSSSGNNAHMSDYIFNRKRVNLYAPDNGPQMYHAKGNLVTRPIITKNLPQVFQYLPIHGKPACNTTLQEFYRNKVREYVGCDLNDEEFAGLENYCSPELLKTGKEITMPTNVPVMGLLNTHILQNKPDGTDDDPKLYILQRNKLRHNDHNSKIVYTKKLKYRGVRMLPCLQEESEQPSTSTSKSATEPDEVLEPGTDILYRVRIYRPYTYNMAKDRYTRSRHSVFSCDVVVSGRHRLSALRDRFVCHNDFDLRVDVSDHPDVLPAAVAKEVFPSGFLFINNVFYVDTRAGCADYSAPIREWARRNKLGDFPRRDMCAVTLDQLVIKLGYPEVYVHQGNCEHVFLFSEIRLLNANDPLRFSHYPCSTSIAQNQTVYCTTCAEFSAKWIVVGSDRVPFDPGFFCDTCFKQYMYKDSQKIGDFKAFRYRGNALNILRPI